MPFWGPTTDVEQILHVGRGFAAGDSAIFRGSIDLFEDGLQLFESLFDRDCMRIFSSRRVFTERPRLRARIGRTASHSQNPKNSEKSPKCFITD